VQTPITAKHVALMFSVGLTPTDVERRFGMTAARLDAWIDENATAFVAEMRKCAEQYAKRCGAKNAKTKERRQADPVYRLTASIRSRLAYAFRRQGKIKRAKAFDMLGYTPQQLHNHITALLKPGMTWDNYGHAWHVDYKKPVAAFRFDGNDPTEVVRRCWALNNLQPLRVSENLAKGSVYEGKRWTHG
jgi:hypothetical protein